MHVIVQHETLVKIIISVFVIAFATVLWKNAIAHENWLIDWLIDWLTQLGRKVTGSFPNKTAQWLSNFFHFATCCMTRRFNIRCMHLSHDIWPTTRAWLAEISFSSQTISNIAVKCSASRKLIYRLGKNIMHYLFTFRFLNEQNFFKWT